MQAHTGVDGGVRETAPLVQNQVTRCWKRAFAGYSACLNGEGVSCRFSNGRETRGVCLTPL